MSKHWRKIGSKDQVSIPSGPPHHAHNNTTNKTKTHKIHRNKSMHSEMDPVWQNPIQRTVRTAHLCVLMTVHSFSTQYNTEQFWWSPLILPDKHHSSDVVYRRRGDTKVLNIWRRKPTEQLANEGSHGKWLPKQTKSKHNLHVLWINKNVNCCQHSPTQSNVFLTDALSVL